MRARILRIEQNKLHHRDRLAILRRDEPSRTCKIYKKIQPLLFIPRFSVKTAILAKRPKTYGSGCLLCARQAPARHFSGMFWGAREARSARLILFFCCPCIVRAWRPCGPLSTTICNTAKRKISRRHPPFKPFSPHDDVLVMWTTLDGLTRFGRPKTTTFCSLFSIIV